MSGRDIKNIIEIIKNDSKTIFSNPIVTVVLIGIIILPSLYAVLNIQACWNPYDNTGDVEFAIANLDNGSDFEGNHLNIGNELVKELKNNDKFKWTFVTEDELRDGVYKGDYYAGIIIPKNLSENVLSISTDDPKQAELEYIVNMKANPVAAKLTDSGSKAVYNALNARIIEFINLAAYGKLGELQEGLASGASQLSSGGTQLQSGAAQISSGADQVSSGVSSVEKGAGDVNDGASKVQKGSGDVKSGADSVKSGASEVKSGADSVKKGANDVKSGVSEVKSGADSVKSGANGVKSGADSVKSGASEVKSGADSVKSGASEVEKGSQELQSAVDPSTLPDPMKTYVEKNIQLANASGQVAQGSSKVADGSVDLAEGSSKLASGSVDLAEGSSKVADGSVDLAEGSSKLAGGSVDLAEGSSKLASGSVDLAEGSSKLADGSSDVAGGAGKLANGSVELAEGSLSLAAGSQLLSNAATQALFSAASALGTSADSLSSITGVDESILGDYFFSPVKLNRHELFPVPNYGSEVSPFYLVLSMWVGAIITCTMLRPGNSEGTKYSPLEMYFGKLLLFLTMSVLQVTVTLIGVFLLGIYIDNPLLFILSSVIVSVVFMSFVYSIVSAIGNVGKAIVIVALVFQISGTGGIYPVEIMDQIFQILNPYLPMTYAITLIREAQLGMVWSNYWPALIILLAIGIVTVILSIIIKEKADKATHYFENSLDNSGIF